MKRLIVLAIALAALLLGCRNETAHTRTQGYDLVIYATSAWNEGFLREVIPKFEAEHSCRVYIEGFANIARLRNRLLQERAHTVADIVVGVDNSWQEIFAADTLFTPYRPREFSAVPEDLVYDNEWRQIPVSWAWLAFEYDSRSVPVPPMTLAQMTISNPLTPYIITDPDSTTTGRALFDWTSAYFGYSGFDKYWQSMAGNLLTIESDWTQAYHRFLAGEAAYVLAHATTPYQHVLGEASDRYRTFIPMEGGYRHIEGLGLVKGGRNRTTAEAFADFCLRADVQSLLPTAQWVMPVRNGASTPDVFAQAPTSESDMSDPERQADASRWIERLWKEWRKAISKV